jgi:tetratricopeptide (TPR) repeat protein
MGKLYMSLKDFDKAMRTFQNITDAQPKYSEAYFYQANIMEMTGKRSEAVKLHKKTLEITPEYVPSLNNLAFLYAEGMGNIEDAFGMAQKAKELAPANGSVTDTLGWVLYKKSEFDESIKYLSEAIRYLPEEPSIRYHLGLAYLKKGNTEKAAEQLNNAIRFGKEISFPEIKDAKMAILSMKMD